MAPLRKPPLLPLTLNIKRDKWRVNDPNFGDADQGFEQMRRRALERDDFSCRFCTFRSPKWQEVHHFNDDHHDNRLENLVTTCQYCHMCQHIGLWGSKREAVLIWLPEMTQVELNHLVRTIQVARVWSGLRQAEANSAVATHQQKAAAVSARTIGDAAAGAFAALKARTDRANEVFKTSDAQDLANVLMLAPDEVFQRKDSWTQGMRLLPLGTRKVGEEDVSIKWLETWMGPGGPYAGARPDTWAGLYNIALKN